MADSGYRQLGVVDEAAVENDTQIIDEETYEHSIINALTPCSGTQDQAVRYRGDASNSDSTAQINNSADNGRQCRESDASRLDTTLLIDPGTPDSSTSIAIRDNEAGDSLQSPVLEQSAQHPTWTDFYFRPIFLISLSVLLTLMIATLEILNYVSQHNQGLFTASEGMHYAWTYGPTLVLTMIAAFWGQLEQRAKQIMPWCLVSHGIGPAQNSLMLNYVTSSTLGSLVRSLRRKHFLVSTAIFGSLILRLTIIFSSGLLRLEFRSLTSERAIGVEDIVDLAKDVSYFVSSYTLDTTAPVTNGLNYWAMFKYGLPHPHGTTSQFAVQSFATGDDGVYDQLTGEIQVFESSLEQCEAFKFTYNTYLGGPIDIIDIPMSLVTPGSGSLQEKLRPWCYGSHADYHFGTSVADAFPHSSSFVNEASLVYKCTNSTAIEDQDHRILFVIEYYLSSNESEISGFMCEPRYSLTRRAVTNSTRVAVVQDNLSITEAIIETLNLGIKPFYMTTNILTGLDSGASYIPDIEWSVWYAMLNATQPQTNLWNFRNTSLVMDLSQRMWKGLAAYIVKHDFTNPSNETINGTVTSTQGRVCVQQLSLRLVEAHIVLLLALIVALCFLRPSIFLRDPTSLGAHSMILAGSPGLLGLFQGYGAASKYSLRTSLSGYLASFPLHLSADSPAIALHQFREITEVVSEKPTTDIRDRSEWWCPVSVRWWFRMCLMTAILVVLIALEVLVQISNREAGLGDVRLEGYLKYTWSFLPSLVLVLVGLLFSMVDSTARTLHSFQLLRKGRATMKDMLHDPARQISLGAVVCAVRERHFVLLWAIFPSLIAPMLTVITSGLYTVVPVPLNYVAELELTEWFRPESRIIDDIDWKNAGDARRNFILTQYSESSYPKWTQGEYALASFGADNLHGHDGNDSSLYITAHVPAARVNFNCSLIEYYTNDTYPATQKSDIRPQGLLVDPRPLGCHPPERNDTSGRRDLYLFSSQVVNVDGTEQTSRGYYYALLQERYDDSIIFEDYDESDQDYIDPTSVCGDKREHHFIGLGYGMEALSLLHCVPYVESLWLTAAFALPDLSLIPNVPITPERDSAVNLSNAAGMTSFMQFIWDDIVVAMINGSSGLGQLTGLPSDPKNDNIRRIIAALESTVAEYFAQVLHFNYRLPLGDNENNASSSSAGQNPLTPDGHPATGTVTDRTRLRLKQNAVSTRILQGLLGLMGACLIASTALGRGARVIPRDPGSIASKMAYFADGEVWRHVPVGADRWTDEQIKKHGLGISGGRLLLDWWGDDQEDSGDEARGNKFAVDSADRK